MADGEEALARANEKVGDQAAASALQEKKLGQLQEELEQKHQALRDSEEKYELVESERLGIEQELSLARDSLKKKTGVLDSQANQLAELKRRFESETQKRRESEERRERMRIELSAAKDELTTLREALAASEEESRNTGEELQRVQEEFDRLQNEHQSVLRVELRQAKELERAYEELKN